MDTMSENTANLMQELERELGVKGPANVLRAALRVAKQAAAQVAEPPAPPAWMVEVVREGCAQDADAQSDEHAAFCYRAGAHDHRITVTSAVRALRLALERGHVVVPRPMPSEEEMLKAAREDVRQTNERAQNYSFARRVVDGSLDDHDEVRAALQARRNMLSEIRAVAPAAVPEVDLEALAGWAWDAGADAMSDAVSRVFREAKGPHADLLGDSKRIGLAHILTTLPTRGA